MTKISPKNIAEAVYNATKGKSGHELDSLMKRTVQVLHSKRLLGRSEEVLQALQNMIEESTGAVRAKVTTAKILGSGERKKLEHEIKEKYKAEHVVGEFFEKAELLGGVRVEVGDEVWDNTYKSKLNKLEKFLMKQG